MSDEIEVANLLAKKFISRRDAKAIQHSDGSWGVHTDTGKHDGSRIPWRRADLLSHLDKSATFGHYMLDTDDTVKLFAFDIDLEKDGRPGEPDFRGTYLPNFGDNQCVTNSDICYADARESWADRSHPGRNWYKFQFKMVAARLMRGIAEELNIHCAAAYSGGKGVHVYGFTGKIAAAEARLGAQIVLDSLGDWEPSRGSNFFRHKVQDPIEGYPNLSIEVFPKQDSLGGKDLGNLMRLPLGRNRKSKDPTFFIDMTTAIGQMKPLDPVRALTMNPWAIPGEG